MRKRFRFKKKGLKFIRYGLVLVFVVIIYVIASFLLSKIKITINNEDLIKYMLMDANKYISFEDKNSFTDIILDSFYGINLNKPITILQSSSYYLNEREEVVLVYNENYQEDIPVIKEETFTNPVVYIYSTHPTETFIDDELSAHNIEPNIKAMSEVLKDKLEEIGVPTIVEQGDIPAYLKEHNYNYNQSYSASKYFLEQFLKEKNDIKLYIDLHRDGTAYKNTVTTIGDKRYAKIMFVLGGASTNYDSTVDTSNKINDYFKKYYPSMTRGMYLHKNSIFNQNMAENMVLIELGGNENKITEVLNTIDVLAQAIKEFVYET